VAIGLLLLAAFFQGGCSRTRKLFTESRTLSPVELFQKLSPSVFVVESVDRNGQTLALGSAVAVSHNLLITNCHVVEGGFFLRVKHGSNKWSAALVEASPDHDMCGLRTNSPDPQLWNPVAEFHRRWPSAKLSDGEILTNLRDPVKFRSAFPNYDGLTDDEIRKHVASRIEPSGPTLSPVRIALSSTVATGERVYAIGAPEGLELTFSEGVVSSLRETEGVHIIQTSAPISPGSSGGGLFDAQGNLIGITTFQLKEGQSLNFALPGEWVSALLDSGTNVAGGSSSAEIDARLESKAWLEIGLDAVKKEDYDVAVHSFHMCTDLAQADAPRAWLELGQIGEMAAGMNSPPDAFKSWLNQVRTSPEQAQAETIADFEKAIELKPDYGEAWLELARVHDERKEYGQAIAAAKEATHFAARNWIAWLVLGTSYTDTASYSEAIRALQEAEKVAPDKMKSSVLYAEGLAYAENDDRDQVVHIYQKLKTSDPKTAELFFHDFVLPQPGLHLSKEGSSQNRKLITILRNASTTDDIRQAAWDAFHAAVDLNDFKRRFDAIPLPEEVKAELWDLKFGSRGNSSPK
jgi:S1-C subfamily serine protease